MRTPRIRLEGRACYHVMSRIVDGIHRLGDPEKERFLAILKACAAFAGVRVHTYSLMDNHFHLLVETPRSGDLSEEEVVRRMDALYPPEVVRERVARWAEGRAQGSADAAEAEIAALRARMGDVSEFMKTLKQRFTQWYNRRNGRRGTLWEDRFKSVLVEGGRAFAAIAAYIEYNPVRAGLVLRPEEYRWSGRWKSGSCGVPVAAVASDVQAAETGRILGAGGLLGLQHLLLCRVRYFTDGIALGSQEFVEEVVRRNRSGASHGRRGGARPLRYCDLDGLFTARELRLPAVTPPQVGETVHPSG